MSKELVDEALALMHELTPEERDEFMAVYRHLFCLHCGAEEPTCQCSNDE